MNEMVKFKGIVISTGNPCVVVFRHLLDEEGNVVDPNICLTYNPALVQTPYGDELELFLASEAGQAGIDLWENLYRDRFSDGTNMLETLDYLKVMERTRTSDVRLHPGTASECLQSALNAALLVNTPSDKNIYEDLAASDQQALEPELTRPPQEEARYLMNEAFHFQQRAEENVKQAERLSPGISREFNMPATPKLPIPTETKGGATAKVKMPQVKGGAKAPGKAVKPTPPPKKAPTKTAPPKKAPTRKKSSGAVRNRTTTRKK